MNANLPRRSAHSLQGPAQRASTFFAALVLLTSLACNAVKPTSQNTNGGTPLSIVTKTLPAITGPVYSFTLNATGGTPPYQWTLLSGTMPAGITLNSAGMLSGTATANGNFTFAVQVSDSAVGQANQSLSLAVSGAAGGTSSNAIPPTFFGIHIDWPTTPWPDISIAAQRLWDSDTGWAQINTAPGVYDWTTMDARVNAAMVNHADLLYDFARTPVWAQCQSGDTTCGSGDATIVCAYNLAGEGGLGQCFPPNDLRVDGTGANQFWIDWVTEVSSRYKGRIKYYEIWNEPSAPVMWQGTNAQLVRMTQDARCIIVGTGCNLESNYTQKAIDPSAQITTPAFVSDQTTDVSTAMNSYLQAGGGQYVDVIAFHGYVQWPNPPEQAVTDTAKLQAVLVSNSQNQKPLFSTEGGFGPKQTISDPDQEAAWIARYLLAQQSVGITRTYWYAWDAAVTPFWSKAAGTEIGGTTYAEVANWLVGASLSSPCTAAGTVWQCGYTRAGGYQALAVWDTSQTCNAGVCSTSRFAVPSGYSYSQDLAGVKTQISAGVQIGIKPILLENQ